jgi:hypothetical protein
LDLLGKHPILDLEKRIDVSDLIKWLRSWGCRQFKNEDENISINNFQDWYNSNKSKLPNINQNLINYDLTINEGLIIELFDNLSICKSAIREGKYRQVDVCVGPVGAAKTLFALRPNLFSPWDNLIYKQLKLECNGLGYVSYLHKIKTELINIRDEAINNHLEWENIFNYLNKMHRSYPKLIDEYFWITLTNKCDPLIIENFCKNGR